MKSKKNGQLISRAEVLNISAQGIWLLVNDSEYFLTYKEFPWFQEGKISEILNVQMPSKHHLYWPNLDVDLELDSLINLEKYPLKYR